MHRLLGILSALTLAVGLAGCFHDDDDNGEVTRSPLEPTAQLRVLHGSPDAPNVDVRVDGIAVLTDVPYKAASGYLDVPTGGINVAVNAAGTPTTVLALNNLDLPADTPFTVIAANTLANIEAIVLDDSAADPASGNLLLRVVHAAAAVPAVDVYLTAADADLGTATPAVSDASFRAGSGFLEIPGGEYRIRVTPTGTTDVVFDSGPVTLAAGAKLTVAALPSQNRIAPIDLVALTGDSAAPTLVINDNRALLRAAHLSPDAPNVDIYVDGVQVLVNVAFRDVTDYLVVESGARNVSVNLAGLPTALVEGTLALAPLSATTAAAVNFAAGIEALAITDDLTPPAAGNAHVRVIHASPDAPNVDVLVDGNLVLSDVPFKGVSDYLPVTAGAHTVRVNIAGTTTAVIGDTAVNLVEGGIYSVIAADQASSIEPIVVLDR